jgi:hypothetical protein
MEQSAETPEPKDSSSSSELGPSRAEGPDPAIGAGLTLFGIFIMGLGGSSNLHYVFNAGSFIAIAGAAVFVLCVALSAMKQRSSGQNT